MYESTNNLVSSRAGLETGKNVFSHVKMCSVYGEVSELADEHDLGSCAERLGGSSPPFPIQDEENGPKNCMASSL
jgi:hypothetical protein